MKSIYTTLAQLVDPTTIDLPRTTLSENRVTNTLQIVFAVASAIALLIIAISAFRIVVSRGNAQDVQKARDSIIYAAIGLIITASAFTIVTFVVERI